MKHWFTGDFHLNHGNIIKYCDRPFKTVGEMDREIIRRFNEKVDKLDIVFFLGDFSFGTPEKYLEQLNGNITFIKGNHDYEKSLPALIHDMVIEIGKEHIYLTHRPEDTEDVTSYFKLIFVAHIHEKWKFKKVGECILVNVGVDVWDYKPISYGQIIKELEEWKK